MYFIKTLFIKNKNNFNCKFLIKQKCAFLYIYLIKKN